MPQGIGVEETLDVGHRFTEKLCKQFPPAEAESRLKAIHVIARLGEPRRTFYHWLKRLGCDFEKLKTEVLKCARD